MRYVRHGVASEAWFPGAGNVAGLLSYAADLAERHAAAEDDIEACFLGARFEKLEGTRLTALVVRPPGHGHRLRGAPAVNGTASFVDRLRFRTPGVPVSPRRAPDMTTITVTTDDTTTIHYHVAASGRPSYPNSLQSPPGARRPGGL